MGNLISNIFYFVENDVSSIDWHIASPEIIISYIKDNVKNLSWFQEIKWIVFLTSFLRYLWLLIIFENQYFFKESDVKFYILLSTFIIFFSGFRILNTCNATF